MRAWVPECTVRFTRGLVRGQGAADPTRLAPTWCVIRIAAAGPRRERPHDIAAVDRAGAVAAAPAAPPGALERGAAVGPPAAGIRRAAGVRLRPVAVLPAVSPWPGARATAPAAAADEGHPDGQLRRGDHRAVAATDRSAELP